MNNLAAAGKAIVLSLTNAFKRLEIEMRRRQRMVRWDGEMEGGRRRRRDSQLHLGSPIGMERCETAPKHGFT